MGASAIVLMMVAPRGIAGLIRDYTGLIQCAIKEVTTHETGPGGSPERSQVAPSVAEEIHQAGKRSASQYRSYESASVSYCSLFDGNRNCFPPFAPASRLLHVSFQFVT